MTPLSFRFFLAGTVLALSACSTGTSGTAAKPRTDTSNWVKAAEVSAHGAVAIRSSLYKEGINSSIEGDYPYYELKVRKEDYSRAVAALQRIKARPLNPYLIEMGTESSGG